MSSSYVERKNGFWPGFIEYFKLYLQELQCEGQALYKLVRLPEANDNLVHFQVIDKDVCLKMPLPKLMTSDLLMDFSKADIATISYLGAKEQFNATKPKLFTRIVRQFFGKGSKTKFLLKMPEQEQLVETTPEEMMTNKEALNMLEGHEAAIIGYTAAENRLMDIKKSVSTTSTCEILQHDLLKNQITYFDHERGTKHTLTVEDIFYNKKLLSLFNKHDQTTVSFTAGEVYQKSINSKKTDFKLITYKKDHAKYRNERNEVITANFTDLAFNANLLNHFSQADRDIIKFAAGEISKEKEAVLIR